MVKINWLSATESYKQYMFKRVVFQLSHLSK